MPFICLAQNLPDGQVQILDLKPNTSQRSLVYEPPGQTQYVNRVLDAEVIFDAAGNVMGSFNGLRAYLVDRVEPAGGSWTAANQATVANGLVARLDAGQGMTLANVNAVIQATFAASDLDGAGSNSTGVLTELLSILAGREYTLATGLKGPGGVWSAVQAGAFTHPVTVFDPDVNPPIGGATVNYENKPIVGTVNSAAFQISLAVGHLAQLAAGITLFPDNDYSAFYGGQWQQPGPQIQELLGARVVTVYDDDGTLLA